MQPNQQQDNVWISREEYERLRQAELSVQALSPVYAQPSYVVDPPARIKPIQAIVGALLAGGLYFSVTTSLPFFRIMFYPILLILLVFAVMSFNDFRKIKQKSSALYQNTPAVRNENGVQTIAVATSPNKKAGTRKYSALMIALFCILALPVVAYIVLIIALFFIIGVAGQGNPGS